MLRASLKFSGSQATLVVKGDLDENSEAVLEPLLAKLVKLDVAIDCAGIGHINSMGFRQWMAFLKSLSEQASFGLLRCTGMFLDYVSMLPTTSYASRIESVLVPYLCATCKRSDQIEHELDENSGTEEFPVRMCERCNGLMHSEVSAAAYLAFCSQ